MAVRQYVGARYVPKFYQNSQNPLSSEWEENKAYEALTVVTYNNSSYTSKIPVPAGIGNPASNPTYWVVTGAYNAQVEQYRQDVDTAVNTVNTNLQETQTKLEGDMQTLKTETDEAVQNMNNTVADVEEKVKNISDKNIIANKRFILIGDSYVPTSDFFTKFIRFLDPNIAWTTHSTSCAESADHRFYQVALGGQGFTQGGSGADKNGFLEILKNAEQYIQNPETITDVYVVGGENDSFYAPGDTGWTLLDNNMEAFNTYVKANYSNSTISLGFIGKIRGTNPSNIVIDNLLNAYYHYIEKGDQLGWPYMNGIEYSLYQNNALLTNDNMHPTQGGGDQIAKNIYQFLTTGSCTTTWIPIANTDITYAEGWSNALQLELHAPMYNNLTKAYFTNAAFSYANGLEITRNTWVKILDQTFIYLNKPVYCNMQVGLLDTGNTWNERQVSFKLEGTGLYVNLVDVQNVGVPITIKNIDVPNGEINFIVPSMWK